MGEGPGYNLEQWQIYSPESAETAVRGCQIPARVIRLCACEQCWLHHGTGVTCDLAFSPFSYKIVDFDPEPKRSDTSRFALVLAIWYPILINVPKGPQTASTVYSLQQVLKLSGKILITLFIFLVRLC